MPHDYENGSVLLITHQIHQILDKCHAIVAMPLNVDCSRLHFSYALRSVVVGDIIGHMEWIGRPSWSMDLILHAQNWLLFSREIWFNTSTIFTIWVPPSWVCKIKNYKFDEYES